MNKIKDIPKDTRPREKLIRDGCEKLNNSELLAIIFGVGSKRQDVLEISEKIFPSYSNAIIYNKLNPVNLAKELDIPITHACKIIAFYELCNRYYKDYESIYINNASDVYLKFKEIQNHSKEFVIGIYLDVRSKIIHTEVISIGTLNSSLISAREVIQPAILKGATFVIICHNHPSGDPYPSNEDIQITKNLHEACKLFNLKLLDHVIIGKNRYMSIKDLLAI